MKVSPINHTDNNSDKKTRQPRTTDRFEDERFFPTKKFAAHSKCEDRVFLERPAGGNAKKLVATVLREGLSAP